MGWKDGNAKERRAVGTRHGFIHFDVVPDGTRNLVIIDILPMGSSERDWWWEVIPNL